MLHRQRSDAGKLRPQPLESGKVINAPQCLKTMIGKQLCHAIAGPFGPGRQQNPLAPRLFLAHMGNQRIEDVCPGSPLRGEVAARPSLQVVNRPRRGLGCRKRADLRQAAKAARGLLPGKIKRLRRQRLVGRTAAERCFEIVIQHVPARLIMVLDLLDAMIGRLCCRLIGNGEKAGKIVAQRFELFVEQRQPVLGSGKAAPFADRLIERVVPCCRAEGGDIAAAETRHRGLVENNLAHRSQRQLLQLTGGALAGEIETAHRFKRIAEEIKPHRLACSRRMQVDDTAAYRVFAPVAHRCRPLEAVDFQPADEPVHVGALAGQEMPYLSGHGGTRHAALYQRIGGGEHDRRLPALSGRGEPAQCGDPPGSGRGRWRHPVIGKTVPCRQLDYFQPRREKGKAGRNLRQFLAVGGDIGDTRTALLLLRQLRKQCCHRTIRHAGKGQRAIF